MGTAPLAVVLAVTDLSIRVGARLLMEEVTFRVDAGDKIGRQDFGERTAGHKPPGLHDADAVAFQRLVEIVQRDQRRHPQLAHQPQDRQLLVDVEVICRLVHDNDVRLPRHAKRQQ